MVSSHWSEVYSIPVNNNKTDVHVHVLPYTCVHIHSACTHIIHVHISYVQTETHVLYISFIYIHMYIHVHYIQVIPPMPSRLSLKLSLLLGEDNSNC